MNRLFYTLTLTADCEAASGFGSSLTDALLPRDAQGRVILPASHLKGVIRENLAKLPADIVPPGSVARLFGREGADPEGSALFSMDDATAPEKASVITITRTALNRDGVAEDKTLRSSEAVACGTVFSGVLTWHPRLRPAYIELLKLGLLSLFGVGGSRRRGAGACFARLEGDERTPGQVLETLDSPGLEGPARAEAPGVSGTREEAEQVFLKLTFKADGPVCVPAVPVVANNSIITGFAIPASAVQGALLHRLNDTDPALADDCFGSPDFRAWPLHPSSEEGGLSVRAPITTKVSKAKDAVTGWRKVFDAAAPGGNAAPPEIPVKTGEGVVFREGDGLRLWRAQDMGRVISAHGVHNRYDSGGALIAERNLFTVESLSPMTFTGLISLPGHAAAFLKESLNEDPFVRLGKARSVRGGGRLLMEEPSKEALSLIRGKDARVFVLQSPAMVSEDLREKAGQGGAGAILAAMVEAGGLGRVESAWAGQDICFGWSRAGKDGGRLPPVLVMSPGSAFRLAAPPENLEAVLIQGLGPGRARGFGGFLPHPGVAVRCYPPLSEPRSFPKARDSFAIQGFKLADRALAAGLSVSQISRVRELTLLEPDLAQGFLDRQRTGRPDRIWDKWKPVILEISDGIGEDPGRMAKVLKVCQDLMQGEGGRS